MGKFINALDNKEALIKLQWVVVAILSIALLLAIHGLRTTSRDLTIHVPPDLRSGATLRAGELPPANVYTFAHYIWQQVNHWGQDGDKDYGAAIFRMQAYLTPSCREWLQRNLVTKANNGELSLRTRALQEIPGREYAESRVRPLSDGAWRVEVDYEITETVRGLPVKAAGVRYPLRVVRFDADREQNPFGLAVDCLNDIEQPSRLDLAAAYRDVAPAPGPRSPAGGAAGQIQDALTR